MKGFQDKPYWGVEPPPEGASGQTIYKEPSYVEIVNNHIYFYGDIGRDEVLQLNKRVRELNNSLLYEAKIQGREPASIFLHINSYGGSIFAGLAAMDTLLSCEVPVITVVDGCCASAATFISVVGGKRVIPRHGFMLIHQLSSVFWGKYREFQDLQQNLDKMMDTIKSIYKEYTKVPMEKLDEILDHDLWFDAKTCLEYGLVDEIV